MNNTLIVQSTKKLSKCVSNDTLSTFCTTCINKLNSITVKHVFGLFSYFLPTTYLYQKENTNPTSVHFQKCDSKLQNNTQTIPQAFKTHRMKF